MTLSRQNVNLIDDTVRAVRRVAPAFNHRDLHLNVFHHSRHYYDNIGVSEELSTESFPMIEKAMGQRGAPRSAAQVLERAYLKNIAGYLEKRECPLSCLSSRVSCFISPSGMVYPCSIWDRALANLKDVDYDLRTLWDRQSTEDVRREVDLKKCPGCWTPCEAYQTILGNIGSLL